MKALSILLASLFSSLNLPATNALERATTDSYGYRRKAPHNSKYDGTVNWELLSHGQQKFSPRHSHATAIFKCPDEPSEQCIWSSTYQRTRRKQEKWTITEFNKFANNKLSQIGGNLQRFEL